MGFTGFADAGHVVKQITAELLDTLDSEPVAVFDADQLIDYRSPAAARSASSKTTCRTTRRRSLALYRLVDGLGKPVPAPGRVRARPAVGAFRPRRRRNRGELDVNLVTWIHSIPMPVPHTRPGGRDRTRQPAGAHRGDFRVEAHGGGARRRRPHP